MTQKPVLVFPVKAFSMAGGGAPIALMAGRAPQFIGVRGSSTSQASGNAGKHARSRTRRVLLLLSDIGDSGELAGSRMPSGGFAAVYDVGFRHIDLTIFGSGYSVCPAGQRVAWA